jgi:tripeptidyl-peptidase I
VGGFTECPVLTVHQFLDVGVVQQQNQSANYTEESSLDLEYAMTLTDPTPVTVLQTGDLVQGSDVGSYNEFVC